MLFLIIGIALLIWYTKEDPIQTELRLGYYISKQLNNKAIK